MFCEETSCSDCKLELIEKRWTQLLLHWLNKCVNPKSKVLQLNALSLLDVINKYKHDICTDDVDRAILCSNDVEPFIKYKYPILRLRYYVEAKDLPKKIYIMTSVLLFHCCVSSIKGHVDNDICAKLTKHEQEIILKYCERLSEMDVTSNNIEIAIKDAIESKSPKTKKNAGSHLAASRSTTPEPNPSGQSDTAKQSSSTILETKLKELTPSEIEKRQNKLKFKSSVTVLPSVFTDTSSASDPGSDHMRNTDGNRMVYRVKKDDGLDNQSVKSEQDVDVVVRQCQPECACTSCEPEAGPCCGDPGSTITQECVNSQIESKPQSRFKYDWKLYATLTVIVGVTIIMIALTVYVKYKEPPKTPKHLLKFAERSRYSSLQHNYWHCKNSLCQKLYSPTNSTVYKSYSRCILLCTGPQIWPYPIGYTHYSNTIVALATTKLEYKFQSVPSETVHRHLAEAFKLFLGDLTRLERIATEPSNVNATRDLSIKKMNIQINVASDPDPRLRVDTDEGYELRVDSGLSQAVIKITAASFCGVRHGLETLSQLILLDQSSGYLITLSHSVVKDAPSFKYRGLMIDTGRNFIPMADLMRTVDAMATCKLNTFHWRISDVTSFPLYLQRFPQLFEYGGYGTAMVYTKDDVKALVNRAGIRGIRVLIEVAVPGPVGRAWSWSKEATCPTKNLNFTCNNVLCMRLSMRDQIFDALELIYSEIIDMTKVDDIFHLSDGVFSFGNCFNLIEEREGFLMKALERLRRANKGFLPKLPIVWYTKHLHMDFEAKIWDRLGVQLSDLQQSMEQLLSRFRVIHSGKWDLSCTMKGRRCQRYRTWQEMYSWNTWKKFEVFSLEGGEAVLWTDLVDSGNLDYHLWPRAAAVAERLWSDIKINNTATGSVYVRLDTHRSRSFVRSNVLHGIGSVPILQSLNETKSCALHLLTVHISKLLSFVSATAATEAEGNRKPLLLYFP